MILLQRWGGEGEGRYFKNRQVVFHIAQVSYPFWLALCRVKQNLVFMNLFPMQFFNTINLKILKSNCSPILVIRAF